MRLTKIALRVWIGMTSMFSFVAGWIMLAQSPKPVQPRSISAPSSAMVAPLPTLAPLPPLDLAGGGAISGSQRQLSIQQRPSIVVQSAPIFTTGGS